MAKNEACDFKHKGVRGLSLFLLCFVLLFAFSAHAQLQIPGCNKSPTDLLKLIPPVPGIKDVRKTLDFATNLMGMTDDDLYNNLDQISPMLDGFHPDKVTDQLSNLDNILQNPSFEATGVLGGMIDGVLSAQSLPAFDAKLRTLHKKYGDKLAQEADPNKKANYVKQQKKISDLIAKWPEVPGAVEKAQKDLAGFLEKEGVMKEIDKAKDLLDKAMNPETLGSDITGLLGKIKNLDMSKLAGIKSKLDSICGMLPNFGDLREKVTGVITAYADGVLAKAKDELKKLAEEALGKLLDKLPLGPMRDKVEDALNKLKNGDLAGAVSGLANSGVNAALDQLGLGGIDGLVNGLGGGGGSRDLVSVGPGFGLLCKAKRISEKYKCPEVECDSNILLKGANSGGKEFTDRVKQYFEYKPPTNNRDRYLDKDHHDYEINKPGEKTRAGAYRMDNPKKGCGVISSLVGGFGGGDDEVSEPCQDNRYRDMCFIGTLGVDHDYEIYGRTLMEDELPFPGIAGSLPQYDKSSKKLSCIVPKNTERLSTLELDNGWRYRDMCPGSQNLRRVPKDKLEDNAYDIFRGAFGCFNPLPKCGLKNDWELNSILWKNKEYKKYIDKFSGQILAGLGGAIGGAVGSLVGGGSDIKKKLEQLLLAGQFKEIEKLMKPSKSAAAECKPAYWVRLMLDSCANQHISQKSFNPDYIYNRDKGEVGKSPRFCQPFRAKRIGFGEGEYDVRDYLKRSYKGLLKDDYMPWIKYDRHENSDANKEADEFRKDNWPERKIKWPSKTWSNSSDVELKTGYNKMNNLLSLPGVDKLTKSINAYADHPVERIIDPLHPFSPRYDIAELSDTTLLTDRNLFGDVTESKTNFSVYLSTPTPNPLGGDAVPKSKKYFCVPSKKQKKGYWEFGCTIYCSAVEVDLLRFRYKDYRLCMGCQIDTNEKAFWDEYKINWKHYRKKYCRASGKNSDCDYGDEICNSCPKIAKHAALAAVAAVGCAVETYFGVTDGPSCKEMKKQLKKVAFYTIACNKCGRAARAESLERTRSGDNKKEEPEWGPTAVGKNWPVCSTRFNHKGDPALCKKAKEEYTCDNQGEKAKDDINIDKESKSDAEKCEKKNIDKICGDAAKPIYSVNFLKIRTRKGDFRTDDKTPKKRLGSGLYVPSSIGGKFGKNVEKWKKKYADEDPADGHGFREYFKNHRPYMRWWDTGGEAFQPKKDPDYWCDWGQNDAVMGVGRDYNSIHGRKAQLCRYGGGAGIGDSCMTMQDWKDGKNGSKTIPQDRKFPSLAGSEWAELKMYQANCFRTHGLSCLCQYEKTFKKQSSEEKVLTLLGAALSTPTKVSEKTQDSKDMIEQIRQEAPLIWRGYVSTPANRDDARTGQVIGKNQQFPYAYGSPKSGSIIMGGLDKAQKHDILIWPAGKGGLPHVAFVEATRNVNNPKDLNFVEVSESNNGKYPDACGGTSYSGRGANRRLYPSKKDLPEYVQVLIEEQVAATYYCDDPELGHCVERQWNNVIIYRPRLDVREMKF
ncbi:MAG: hypothetical protein P8P30_00715 [Rickettsiales bacterium]|nr:hypothetical protein [Rickettsiales bacterium]